MSNNTRNTNRNKRDPQSRSIHNYSVDVAAKRGVPRQPVRTAQTERPMGIEVAQKRRKPSADVPRNRSRNVDVAQERRQSGYVDVMTGKRLDGRVKVPVDKRRQRAQETSDNRNRQQDVRKNDRNVRNSEERRRRSDRETQGRQRLDKATQGRQRPDRGVQGRQKDDRDIRGRQESGRDDWSRQTADREGRGRRNSGRDGQEMQRPGGNRQNASGRRNSYKADRNDQRRKNAPGRNKVQTSSGKKQPSKKRKPTPQEIEHRKKLKQQKLERRRVRRQKMARILKIVLRVILVLAVLCGIAFVYIKSCYRLKNVKVSGTDHYTDQQMIDIVTGGKDYGNTLLFLLESRLNPALDVTFIDKIDVTYVDRNTVEINVYEKAMAGCIKSGSHYVYFDGDGTVLELSDNKLDDVPCIEGLTSDDVKQGEKLVVEDPGFFQEILTMTQLIYKSGVKIDKITYDDGQNLILHKDGIKINIGGADNLETKFLNLQSILDSLNGKKGTLDMSNYSTTNRNVIFKENK